MNYAVEQRLRFIDYLVYKYGYINRNVIADYYGISNQQAAKDIKEYKKLAPKNIDYHLSEKRYLKSSYFVSLYNAKSLD